MQDKPLVTLTLLAYNQEHFVREAIEGALSQTYEPLEIILSDDASTDGTFAVMQSMAEAYRGPHRIVLNRNENNLGLAGHINRVVGLSRGALLVGAAADDVSMPERVARLVEAWEDSGRRAMSVFSNAVVIDDGGKVIAERYYPHATWSASDVLVLGHWELGGAVAIRPLSDPWGCSFNSLLGATQAFSRSTVDYFGPLSDDLVLEDHVIPFRALLLGRIAFVDEPLVRYRWHGKGMTLRLYPADRNRASQVRSLRQRLVVESHRIADLRRAHAGGLVDRRRFRELEEVLFYRRRVSEVKLALYDRGPLAAADATIRVLFSGPHRVRFVLRLLARALRF